MLVEVKVYEEISRLYGNGRFTKTIEYMGKNKIPYSVSKCSDNKRKVVTANMTFKQIKKMYKKVGPELLGAVIF